MKSNDDLCVFSRVNDMDYLTQVNYNAHPNQIVDYYNSTKDIGGGTLDERGKIVKPDFTKYGMSSIALIMSGIQISPAIRDAHPDEYMKYVKWAQKSVMSVRTGAGFINPTEEESKMMQHLPHVESFLDITSTNATQYNRPDMINKVVRELITKDEAVLMIPLGNGAAAIGADNFASLDGEDNVMHNVWFSVKKKGHDEPILGKVDKEYLVESAKDRVVVISEDDIYSGRTVYKATKYFKKLLGSSAIYVLSSQRGGVETEFGPELVKLGKFGEEEKMFYRKFNKDLAQVDYGFLERKTYDDDGVQVPESCLKLKHVSKKK